MEHPCNQCAAAVEDGTPFCPQCHAPQIRVAAFEPHTEEQSSYGPLQGSVVYQPSLSGSPPLSFTIDWRRAFRLAAIAGLIAAVLTFTLLGVLGLGMLIGGFLAVALYKRNYVGLPPSPATGSRLGALTGAFGFAFFSLFLAAQIAIFHKGGELRATLIHAVEQAAARSTDPSAQAVVNWLKSPEGLTLMIALSLLFTLIVFLILGSLGGALGAVILRRRRRLP